MAYWHPHVRPFEEVPARDMVKLVMPWGDTVFANVPFDPNAAAYRIVEAPPRYTDYRQPYGTWHGAD